MMMEMRVVVGVEDEDGGGTVKLGNFQGFSK